MAAENKPEGLKKIRNLDRMYRSAVCYAGHAPAKGVSDETEINNDHGNSNGSHVKIFLPKKLLECLPKCSSLPKERHRWNTNEEIAAYLITFEKHEEWLTTSPKTRPQNGSMILYNRKKVKYRKDGYCWKKRKDGKTTREDHMKLKVQGVECLYGCYVHSSIIPTFHRRCYWLLQNPDIVLVHYLNVPAIEDCGKPCGPILCSINTDKKEWAKWTKEELIGQLKPMFHGIKWTCSNGNSSTGFSVEQLVQQILDSHQTKPPPRTHNCLCTGTLGKGWGRGSEPGAEQGLWFPPTPSKETAGVPCLGPDICQDRLQLLRDPELDKETCQNCCKLPLPFRPSLTRAHAHTCPPRTRVRKHTHRSARGFWTDNQFRMSILERLEQMERRMAEMSGHHQQGAGGTTGGTGGGAGGNTSQTQCMSGQGPAGSSFESRVVVVCEKMMSRACWAKSKHLIHSKTFRGMTLLHLAAAQGYATLIQTLIKWRSKHADSIDLELEVDPLNVDHFSCTPLMWACALGHMEAAVVLYKWDRRALAIPDSLGRLPLSIARSRGHTKLADCLEQLQRDEQQQPPSALPPAPRLAFSPAPDTPAPDSWMVAWGSDTVAAAPGQKGGGAGATTNPSPDLRRPRSEPSSYYSSECQRDLPLAKKHKPNPEFFQGRPDKAMSVPLSLEQQQLHKLSGSPKAALSDSLSPDKSLEEAGGGSSGGLPHHKLGAFRGLGGAGGGGGGGGVGSKWGSRELYSAAAVTLGAVAVQPAALGRKGAGAGGGSSLGKEKLASRLRQREPLSVLMMSEREMVDTELLSYRDDLENQDCLAHMDDLQVNMMTLAEHIIEATPERIKRENFVAVETTPLDSAGVSNTMSWLASYLGDVEHLPSVIHLRSLYSEPLTPSSNPSLSPAGSPLREGPFEKPSLPSPADWTDFLSASNSKVERDLAQLTLSDPEQRELYEAARLVQTAFRKYKGRPLREQQEVAAAVIQRCYRKYKQLTWIALKYALYKKMTQAAILIQSKFRSYHEQKKFQQSRRAAVLIQQYYRSYKEFGRLRPHRRAAAAALVQHKLRSSLLTKKQDQAARKIMRFLRRCRHRVKELRRDREHETLQKNPLTM
nr:PREDICTED: calmodulin-binding transcription activator 1 [Lepisosteus oculatus]